MHSDHVAAEQFLDTCLDTVILYQHREQLLLTRLVGSLSSNVQQVNIPETYTKVIDSWKGTRILPGLRGFVLVDFREQVWFCPAVRTSKDLGTTGRGQKRDLRKTKEESLSQQESIRVT